MRAKFINEREDLGKYRTIQMYLSDLVIKIKDYLVNDFPSEDLDRNDDCPGFYMSPKISFVIDWNGNEERAFYVKTKDGERQLIITENSLVIAVTSIKENPERAEEIVEDIEWSSVTSMLFRKLVHVYDDIKYDDKNVDDVYDHNAYFLKGVNKIMRILHKEHEITDFESFKEIFLERLNKFADDVYNSTTDEWRKNLDKRMYDLYTKLKEQGRL